MDLRESIREGFGGEEGKKKRAMLNIDTFGEIMDEFVHKSKCGLLVTKEENSDRWEVHGAGCGAVLDFYIFLNAGETIYLQMLEEIGRQNIDAEKLAEALTKQIKISMVEAAKKEGF